MLDSYYSFPLELDQVIQQRDLKRISLFESVVRILHLITTTHFGECKHDPEFGCSIWDHDFETISNFQHFKETIKNSTIEAIAKYEPRLTQVVVEVGIEQMLTRVKSKRVKNRIQISVKGKLVKTNEDFFWKEQFFIGPLSYN